MEIFIDSYYTTWCEILFDKKSSVFLCSHDSDTLFAVIFACLERNVVRARMEHCYTGTKR